MVEQYIEQDDLLPTLDLHEGFFHIIVCPEDRQYLCFQWQGVYFQWWFFPFRLSLSPEYFSKILWRLVIYLRSQGAQWQAYVHDFLMESQQDTFIDPLNMLTHTLQDLGWNNINQKKASLHTEYTIIYIGYKTNTDVTKGNPSIQIAHPKCERKLMHGAKAGDSRELMQ